MNKPFSIGLLVHKTIKGKWVTPLPLFHRLQAYCEQNGGTCFLFTLPKKNVDTIQGRYLHSDQTWKQDTFSFPDVIYNRVSSRKVETTEQWSSFLRYCQKQQTLFFNPHFFQKIAVVEALQQNKYVKKHLPVSTVLTDEHSLKTFLREHSSIYAKSNNGRKGSNLYKLDWFSDTELIVHSTTETVTETYPSFFQKLLKQDSQFLLQQAITPHTLDGLRYDYRVLAHAVRSEHKITGIGIRASAAHAVTTHVPRGGMILPYNAFSDTETEKILQKIVHHIGKSLTSTFGEIGEFSVDIGKDSHGHLYVFEVNAKPMTFDELPIEQARVKEIVHQAMAYASERRSVNS